MGSIIFDPESLADTLSETAGYKAGLALSVEQLCDHLSGTEYPDIIRTSETHVVRLRSEKYEDLFFKLLHRIGYMVEEYNGDYTGAYLFHKYRDTALAEYEGVIQIFVDIWPRLTEEAHVKGTKTIDPRPFIQACFDKYGKTGLDMAMERLEVLDRALNLNPHSMIRYMEWRNPLHLNALFMGTNEAPEQSRFIDQRFINYLSQNPGQLSAMHWRKLEELAAEFFHREGFKVQLGPGSNDDGVDVRVWKAGSSPSDQPLCLVQCKRQKSKIERVVVKGLHADVVFEEAEYGLIVTTAELSPGARSTIAARGYPVREVNRIGLDEWLERLRTPGTGIVRT